MVKLEIAVTTLEDAIRAEKGGANSVELSVDLARDGLTPPIELMKAVREAVKIDLHVMVRPHDRDFVYQGEEIDLILAQAKQFAEMGVTGIVFGAHHEDGTLDVELIKQIAEVAGDCQVTLHRAIDSCSNPEVGLEAVVGVVDRVLTSGPAATVWEGRFGLRDWVEKFGNQFSFVAAGSIKLETIQEIAAFTGVHECHSSSAARTDGEVDVEKVRGLLHELATLGE
jgi:copper homeostasis protein